MVNHAQKPTPVSDTSREAAEVRLGILRRMTLDQKAEEISEGSEALRDTMIAGVRFRHPEYTQAEARWATIRHLLGDGLFAAAYPGRGSARLRARRRETGARDRDCPRGSVRGDVLAELTARLPSVAPDEPQLRIYLEEDNEVVRDFVADRRIETARGAELCRMPPSVGGPSQAPKA